MLRDGFSLKMTRHESTQLLVKGSVIHQNLLQCHEKAAVEFCWLSCYKMRLQKDVEERGGNKERAQEFTKVETY